MYFILKTSDDVSKIIISIIPVKSKDFMLVDFRWMEVYNNFIMTTQWIVIAPFFFFLGFLQALIIPFENKKCFLMVMMRITSRKNINS